MQKRTAIGQIVIVGGGPVGNFCAVLAGVLGIKCTAYEKRDSYIRQINLKIQKDFFLHVGKVIKRLTRKNTLFFQKLNEQIAQKNGKILLKNLEQKLKDEAINNEVKYCIGKQIKSFQQIQKLHQHNNPLILDCAGRKSLLRQNHFGKDQQNMRIYNLHHALHVNFKAVAPRNFDFKLLYPVLKNINDLKLGQVIISKKKQSQSQIFSHVTVPLFISDSLSDLMDKNYPNINRTPLKPFSLFNQIQPNPQKMIKQVQQVIYSLFCALIMEEWDIDWASVVLKKINITCGYGIRRSQGRYICMGDSAAHFAYFKSLNFGLRHAFQLFKIVASYHGVNCHLPPIQEKQVVNRVWKKNPQLWPVSARQGPSAAQYFVTTSQLKVLAPYIYNIADDRIKRIDLIPQIFQQKIQNSFQKYKAEVKLGPWQDYLDKFEKIRKFDIDSQIMSNRSKKAGTEVIAYFIWLNGLSPIKFSQTVSLMTNGYYLQKKDFQYFQQLLQSFKHHSQNWQQFSKNCKQKIEQTLKKQKISQKQQIYFSQILSLCNPKHTIKQFCQKALKQNSSQQKSIQKKMFKNKKITIMFKVMQIIAFMIQNQSQSQNQDKKQDPFNFKQIKEEKMGEKRDIFMEIN